jgi:TDG/mug DNA glycosylase family protein
VYFNGKKAAQVFFETSAIEYGLQQAVLGKTKFFVAPSASGAARRYWQIAHWEELVCLANG